MKISIISFTKRGTDLSKSVFDRLKDYHYIVEIYAYEKFLKKDDNYINIIDKPLIDFVGEIFYKSDIVLFIGAMGIAVRAIAPYIKDKYIDPAILCMDDYPRYIIPILSGHIGGANKFARFIESILDVQAIITTATDNHGLWAVDEWAKDNNLYITDRSLAKFISASLLEGKGINIFSDYNILKSTSEYFRYNNKNIYSVYISNFTDFKSKDIFYIDSEGGFIKAQENLPEKKSVLRLIPRNICLGIGCKKDMPFETIKEKLDVFLKSKSIDIHSVNKIASIDIKNKEQGIIKLAEYLNIDFITFTKQELLEAKGNFEESDFVKSITGVGNVCERAASLIYPDILCKKVSYDGITFALSIDKNINYIL